MDKNVFNLKSDMLKLKTGYQDKETHEENFQDNGTVLYLGYGTGYTTVCICKHLELYTTPESDVLYVNLNI